MNKFNGNLWRVFAQFLFFSSLICLIGFYGGVLVQGKWICAVLLALSCFIQSLAVFEYRPLPGIFKLVLGLIAVYLSVTLLPWPTAWCKYISPGQNETLLKIQAATPRYLSLSMAPFATVEALGILFAAFVVFYLNSIWSTQVVYRRTLFTVFVSLAFFVAGASVFERLCPNTILSTYKNSPGVWGFFVNRNHLASFLNFCVVLGLGLFFSNVFPRQDETRSILNGFLIVCALILIVVVSVSTFSRGGLLSLSGGFLVYFVLTWLSDRHGIRLKILSVGFVIFILALLTLGKTVVARTEAVKNFETFIHQDSRWSMWKAAWRMSNVMSGRGIGVGAFETTFPIFQQSAGHRTITHLENEYLEVLAEWGLLGSLLLLSAILVFLLFALKGPVRHWDDFQIAGWSAVSMMMLHSVVDFPVRIPANAFILLSVLSFLFVDGLRVRSITSVNANSKGRLVLAFCGMILACMFISEYYPAAHIVKSAEDNLIKKKYRVAQTESSIALKTWPFYWRAYEVSAYAVLGTGYSNLLAQQLLTSAQQLTPSNPEVSLHAGFTFFDKDPELALDFFEQACALSEEPLKTWNDILQFTGDKKQFSVLFPLAESRIDFWERMMFVLWDKRTLSPEYMDFLKQMGEEGIKRWWSDASGRNIVCRFLAGNLDEILAPAFDIRVNMMPIDYYWKGVSLSHMRNYREASLCYRQAFEMVNKVPVFKHQLDLTDEVLLRAEVDLSNNDLQEKIASSLFNSNRFADALQAFRRVLQNEPKDLKANYGLAVCYLEIGDFESATKAFQSLIGDPAKLKLE